MIKMFLNCMAIGSFEYFDYDIFDELPYDFKHFLANHRVFFTFEGLL